MDFIVTSRSNNESVAIETRRELESWGVEYDELIIIPDAKEDQIPCPHSDLDWYQQYLWQKVAVCLERSVDVVFEDDEKVIALFKEHAPSIQVFEWSDCCDLSPAPARPSLARIGTKPLYSISLFAFATPRQGNTGTTVRYHGGRAAVG